MNRTDRKSGSDGKIGEPEAVDNSPDEVFDHRGVWNLLSDKEMDHRSPGKQGLQIVLMGKDLKDIVRVINR